jgi:hypothetical protein
MASPNIAPSPSLTIVSAEPVGVQVVDMYRWRHLARLGLQWVSQHGSSLIRSLPFFLCVEQKREKGQKRTSGDDPLPLSCCCLLPQPVCLCLCPHGVADLWSTGSVGRSVGRSVGQFTASSTASPHYLLMFTGITGDG